MGSNNSRSAGNMSESPRTQRRSSTDEEPDLPSIVAYLIRSGQISFMSSEDFPSDEDSSDPDYLRSSLPPVQDPSPDVTSIESNDVKQQILLDSGRWAATKQTQYSIPTLTHLIQRREIGMDTHQHFSAGNCCLINSRFLPNKCKQVAQLYHKVFCGTYSQDGNVFLTACQDQNVRLFNTQGSKFELFKTIHARDVGWSVLDVAFSPDGSHLIYSSWSDSIHLCNIYGDHDVHEPLPLHPGENSFCIFSLMFSSDNREIIGGANDGCLYVYDRESNQRTLKIEAHDDDVNAVCFADSSSQILYSGSDDGLCKVWDRRTLREDSPLPVGVMGGHYDGITFIDSKGDARYFVSNSKDQTIKLWDMRVFSSKDGIEATKKAVSGQRWDYRWQQVPKRMTKKRRLGGDTSVMTYRGHSVLHTLIRCRFSPAFTTGQRYIYTGCSTGSIVVYDVLTGKVVRNLEGGHKSCVRDISWHPYQHTIISSSWDGTVGQWDYFDYHAHEPEEGEIIFHAGNDLGRFATMSHQQKVIRSRRNLAKIKTDSFRKLYD
ncbi:DDB1- and CUL4-associated factor 11-like isoform X1 [Pomacea canaliculata]|uniref:DDB1- and CUL4-associated factor 11-like isoform X1 n=1 Tax=Pomacea canaliculata TaxID=400727 RepID=UPI000D72D33F|nr:DDB1- and CUL4-associated factor 11-like isoform X1 [Pomacea canaliculata]